MTTSAASRRGVRRRRRLRVALLGALVAMVAFGALLAFAAWRFLQTDRLLRFVAARAEETLGRPVAAASLEYSLTDRSVVLTGLQIGRAPGEAGPAPPVFSVGRLEAVVSWRSLFPTRFHLESLSVEGVGLRGFDDGDAAPPPEPADGALASFLAAVASRFTFSSDRIRITGDTIGYRNRPTPWEVRVDDVRLALGEGDSGGFAGEIESGVGVVRLWDRPGLELSLDARFRLEGSVLHLDAASLNADLVALEVEGSLDLAADLAGRLGVRGDGDAGGIGRFLFEFDGLDTDAEPRFDFDGEAGFQENGLFIEGDFHVPSGRFMGAPIREWRGLLHWDPDRVEIAASEGEVAGGRGALDFRQIQPREDNPADIDAEVRGARLGPAVAGVFGVETTLRSVFDVDASLKMPLHDPLAMTGTIRAAGRLPPEPTGDAASAPTGDPPTPVGFELDLVLSDEDARVRRAVVETPATRSTAEGVIPRGGSARIAVATVAGEAAEVDVLQQEFRRVFFAEPPETTEWDVAGGGRLTAGLTGQWPELLLSGEVEGQGMRFSAIQTETLVATGRIGRDVIFLDRLAARGPGESRLSASGEFVRGPGLYPDMEFEAAWEDWDAREIIDFLEWDFEADGATSGRSSTVRRAERYTGDGAATAVNGAILEQPFDEVEVAWTMDGDVARIEPMRGSFQGGRAAGRLDVGLVGFEMDGVLHGEDYPLTPGLAPEWIGLRSDFELAMSGDLYVPVLELSARVPEASVLGLPLGPGSLEGTVTGETFVASGGLDSGRVSFEAEGTVPVGIGGAGRVEVRGVDVASLIVEDAAERGLRVVASGSGDFHVENPTDEWMTGTAEITGLSITAPDFHAESSTTATIRLEDARVRVADLALAYDRNTLFVQGSVGLDDRLLDLDVNGEVRLGVVEGLIPDVTAAGSLSLESRIRGDWADPEVAGRGRIRDATLGFAGFPHAFREIHGDVVFDGRSFRVAELTGELAQGPVVLSGGASFVDLGLEAFDLDLQLSDSRIRYPRDFAATVDADLQVVGDADGRLVTGSVRLDDASWTREFELLSTSFAEADDAPLADAEDDGGAADLRLDIAVTTDAPLAVRNTVFELDAEADLHLRGTLARPAVLGRADFTRGEAYFWSHRFEIVGGRADFVDPAGVEPLFEVEAESRVRSYRVALRASGSPGRMDANLSSDPPLPSADIVRLLSGAPEEDLLTSASDDDLTAASAVSFLSQALTGAIGRRAGNVFGLDRLSVDPYLVGRVSNPTARVTLGKQLLPDLSARYSWDVSGRDEAIIIVEYTPEGPISWILSRDEDGSLGVDLRFQGSF